MHAQSAAGHDVFYLFSGRHYPKLERPRLKRWRRRGVRMLELIGSPNNSHWEAGTRYPLRDLDEPAGEAAFEAAMREASPDLIHIQELAGLPSSLIERARGHGVPVLMTLHDYKPLCASVRLLDADRRRCERLDVGQDCARNCAGAPDGYDHLINWTIDYEMARVKGAIPFAGDVDFSVLAPVIGAAKQLVRGDAAPEPEVTESPAPAPSAPAADYQRRRDVNVERLGLCDRLVAPSRRVAEMYSERGVDRGRIVVQRLTLPHLEGLRPRATPLPPGPLTFVTLGSCASPSKGSRLVAEAVTTLERAGRGGDYRLIVLGYVEPVAHAALAGVESVELAGPYKPSDLDRHLGVADVGLLPSTWEEVHGFVGIEMLAKGLPLIANALGGIPEYVEDGKTGWLNRSATAAELAELMAAAIDDRAGVDLLKDSVRDHRSEIVRPFGEHLAEVEALYAELVSAAE